MTRVAGVAAVPGLVLFVSASVALGVGCGAAAPRNPGTLARPAVLGEDVMLRQRIVVRRDGAAAESFECVLQKRGESLVVLVLTPFGTRAFSVEQDGDDARVVAAGARPPPFPPRWILLDVQRALALPGHMVADGPHRERRGADTVDELWRQGRLLERRYRRDDEDHPIVIRYLDGGMTPPVPPRRIHYRNPWARYSLLIVTLERTPL